MTVALTVALWPCPRDGMVDITDLKSVALGRTGSSPVGGTTTKRDLKCPCCLIHYRKNIINVVKLKTYQVILGLFPNRYTGGETFNTGHEGGPRSGLDNR